MRYSLSSLRFRKNYYKALANLSFFTHLTNRHFCSGKEVSERIWKCIWQIRQWARRQKEPRNSKTTIRSEKPWTGSTGWKTWINLEEQGGSIRTGSNVSSENSYNTFDTKFISSEPIWLLEKAILRVILLTHSFLMHSFSTPWKHQKTVRFSRGREGALRTNGLSIFTFFLKKITLKGNHNFSIILVNNNNELSLHKIFLRFGVIHLVRTPIFRKTILNP